MDTLWKPRKVVIVGAGAVGSTFAYALAQRGVADEICLTDIHREFAAGQVLDLAHGLPFYPSVQISAGRTRRLCRCPRGGDYRRRQAGAGRIAAQPVAEKRRDGRIHRG